MCDTPCSDLLKFNNDKILSYIYELKTQRDDVVRTIRKQEEEKAELAIEMERLAYKSNILSKSLAQRMITRDRYNEAIVEAEEYYNKLVKSSEALLNAVEKDFNELYESMDKKVGPDMNNCAANKPINRAPCRNENDEPCCGGRSLRIKPCDITAEKESIATNTAASSNRNLTPPERRM